jgi:hypothetical protein
MGHKPTFRTLVATYVEFSLARTIVSTRELMGARLAHQPLLQTVFEPITDLPVLEQHLPSGD